MNWYKLFVFVRSGRMTPKKTRKSVTGRKDGDYELFSFLSTTNDPAPHGRSPAELNWKAETWATLTDCQCDVERTRSREHQASRILDAWWSEKYPAWKVSCVKSCLLVTLGKHQRTSAWPARVLERSYVNPSIPKDQINHISF